MAPTVLGLTPISLAVGVVFKHRFASVTARREVEQLTAEFDANWPSREFSLRPGSAAMLTPDTNLAFDGEGEIVNPMYEQSISE